MESELAVIVKESAVMTPIDRWVAIKERITKVLKAASRRNAGELQLLISQLSEATAFYEDNMPLSESDTDVYIRTKCELEDLMKARIRGVTFRSGVRLYDEGEKNTKYFYNLEKACYNNKTCPESCH